MTIELNSESVLTASVHFPMNGAWSAELSVASDATLAEGDAASLKILDQTFVGRVVRAGLFSDRLSVRVTGGAADWSQPVDVKHYRNTTADRVLGDVGLTLAAPVGTALPFWTRTQGTVGSTIQTLARYIALNWRVQPGGAVFLGPDTQTTAEDPEAVEIGRDPGRGIVQLAPERATILPGLLFGQDTVGDVVYNLTSDGVRCVYYTDGRATLRGSLERLIRWVMRDTTYFTLYTAQVIRQAADGTLDLLPDDLRLQSSGLQGVPIRHGLPGVTVKVPAGERVLLGFDSGDPTKPYAALWHEGQVTTVSVGGSEPVALAELVSARLDAIQQAFDTHTHTVTTVGSSTTQTGTTAPPATPINALDPVAAEVLQTR